jgi:hypothetical protein
MDMRSDWGIPDNCPECGAKKYHKRKGVVYYECGSRAGNYEMNARWFNQSCECERDLLKAELNQLRDSLFQEGNIYARF